MIAQDWLPTPESINALPEPLRRYIHDLETRCDRAGEVAERINLREQVNGLSAMKEEVEARLARMKHIAHQALKSRSHYKRLTEALWDGEFDCPSCGVLTNNGYCTGCTHGTSKLALARAETQKLYTELVQRRADVDRLERENATALARARRETREECASAAWLWWRDRDPDCDDGDSLRATLISLGTP